MRKEGERLCERRMRSSDCERRLVPALIYFRSAKKDRSAPNPVERRVLHQSIPPPSSIHYPSGVPPSIRISIFRRASRPPSGSPYSAGRSALRRPLRLQSGIPLSVEFLFRRSVVRWVFRPPLSVPPSVGLSAFRRASRPPSGYPSSVGRSDLRQGLRFPSDAPPFVEFYISAISCLLSVSPSFKKFEDCVLNTPTGYYFSNLRTMSSKRWLGPDSSDMRTVSYISRQDLVSRNLRTTSSKSWLISCTLSMSHDTDIAVNCDKITATGNKYIFLKTSAYPVPLENPITFWSTVKTFLILSEYLSYFTRNYCFKLW